MTPLEEASRLLGVQLEDVQRDAEPPLVADYRSGRPDRLTHAEDVLGRPQRRGWTVRVRGHAGDLRTYKITSSAEIRSPAQLGHLACRMGRDPALPRLSARDGRTLLRLFHQANDQAHSHKQEAHDA